MTELKMHNGSKYHPHYVTAGGYWYRFATREHFRVFRRSLTPGQRYVPHPTAVCRADWFPLSNTQVLTG